MVNNTYIKLIILILLTIGCNNIKENISQELNTNKPYNEFDVKSFINETSNCSKIDIFSRCCYVNSFYKIESRCNYTIGQTSNSIIKSYDGIDSIFNKKTIDNILKSIFNEKMIFSVIDGSDLRIVLRLKINNYSYNIGINEKSILINDSIYIETKINPIKVLLKMSPKTQTIFDAKYKSFKEIITYDTIR